MKSRILVLLVLILVAAFTAYSQTTEFTYQGRITQSGLPMNATRGIQFYLFDENGVQIPGAVLERSVTIVNGVFSTTIDFGAAAFASGANRSLQIAVANTEDAGDGYTFLSPRQPISSAPYALKSKSADTATSASTAVTATSATTANTATNAANLGGVAASQFVLTTDTRLFDARPPLAGSSSYIQSVPSTQQLGSFNVSGNSTVGANFAVGTNLTVGANINVGANLLIGTTVAQSKLTVQTPTHNYGFLHTDGNISFGSFVGGNSAPVGGWFGTKTPHPLYFFTNDSSANMAILPSGKIGIGTTSPLYRLDVSGGSFSAIRGIAPGTATGVYGSGYFGVYGEATGDASSAAVYGQGNVGYAGFFAGRVHVSGTLSKSGGSFKIDHPLDPANKYLSHSFVESPDMMNIYNGNVVTDERGEMTVTMPDYFSALNRDFRYQLTVIGQFAQAIVLEKVKGNQFKIKTDKPNVEVSWQLTGIRQDVYANENRILVEEDKRPTERGLYLYPKGFNQGVEKSVFKSRDLTRAKEQK